MAYLGIVLIESASPWGWLNRLPLAEPETVLGYRCTLDIICNPYLGSLSSVRDISLEADGKRETAETIRITGRFHYPPVSSLGIELE